jgi:hypothetical protein
MEATAKFMTHGLKQGSDSVGIMCVLYLLQFFLVCHVLLVLL